MIYSVLLQADSGMSGMPMNLIFIGAIILVFYFFMIRPQQKKAKDQRRFREDIKKGDKIVTIGGLHGKLISLEDQFIVLEVDKGIKLTLERSAISMEATRKLTVQDKK